MTTLGCSVGGLDWIGLEDWKETIEREWCVTELSQCEEILDGTKRSKRERERVWTDGRCGFCFSSRCGFLE